MRLPAPSGLLSRSVIAAALLAAAALAGAGSLPAQNKTDRAASARLFVEMAAVFEHPRCMNCHANAAYPTQGGDRHRHTMNVARGPDDHGAAGLHCSTCHQAANQIASGVPGAPDWHLAPLRMAWTGLAPAQLCHALFDPAHGDMTPDRLVAHFDTGLVRWAWSPGADAHGEARSTPPLSHDAFIRLTREWVASGAVCPD